MDPLFWTHSADHTFAHLLWRLFDFAECGQFGHNRFHNLSTLFDVSQLAAAKHQGDLHFVLLLQEADSLLHLEIDIVLTRFWTETNFFDSGVVRVLMGLLFLFILVLAVVHDPADRRALVGRHLHKIEAHFPRLRNGLRGRDDSQLLPIGTDNAYGGDANLFIHSSGNAVDS